MANKFMQMALAEASLAAQQGEVPVGAVLVQNDVVIARAHNLTMEKKNILAHAEMLVLNQGLKQIGHRLDDCHLYVTLEPCSMCAGAILLARPARVYFGAYDGEAGACGGKHDVLRSSGIEVYGGIMEQSCSKLLRDFFADLRNR